MRLENHFYKQRRVPNGLCDICGYQSDDSYHREAVKEKYTPEFLEKVKNGTA